MPWQHYRPTQDQITEGCEAIREAWDEATHRNRWARETKDDWLPPKVKVALLLGFEDTRKNAFDDLATTGGE